MWARGGACTTAPVLIAKFLFCSRNTCYRPRASSCCWTYRRERKALGRKCEICVELAGGQICDVVMLRPPKPASREEQSEGWRTDSSPQLCGYSTVENNARAHSCCTHECSEQGFKHTYTTHQVQYCCIIIRHDLISEWLLWFLFQCYRYCLFIYLLMLNANMIWLNKYLLSKIK